MKGMSRVPARRNSTMAIIQKIYCNPFVADVFAKFLASTLAAIALSALGLFAFVKPRVKISRKIAHGRNYSAQDGKSMEYKFKIVNKSYFITAYDFDIHLYPVKKVRCPDNTDDISVMTNEEFELKKTAMKRLSKYKPDFYFWLCKRFKEEYISDFTYRIVTRKNIEDISIGHDKLLLVVSYYDSFGKKQIVQQLFDPRRDVYKGEFTNDGNLKKIHPLETQRHIIQMEVVS